MNNIESFLHFVGVRDNLVRRKVAGSTYPSRHQASRMVESNLTPFEKGVTKHLTQSVSIRELLAQRRQLIEGGSTLSRAALCTDILDTTVLASMYRFCQASLNEKDIAKFIFWGDAASGFGMTVNSVKTAESIISMGTEGVANKAMSDLGATFETPEEAAELTDYMLSLNRGLIHSNVNRLLIADPTGFHLVDMQVKALKDTAPAKKMFVKDYVIAGAEAAQRLYKALYPLIPAA